MDFFTFVGISSRVFFHPFNALSETYEILQNESKQNRIKWGFLISLMGSTSMILSNIIMNNERMWNSIVFLIYHICFSVFVIYVIQFFILVFFYFIIYLIKENVELDKLISLYLFPDFLLTGLLPIAVILKAVLPDSSLLYSILTIIFFIIAMILKIKAISIVSLLSKGKSFGLFILPYLFTLFFIGISLIYFFIYLSRLFM